MSNTDLVAADLPNIDAVAGALASVNSVASDLPNLNALAAALANLNLVKASLADVSAVAAYLSQVQLVGENISSVMTNAANMATVLANLSTINTVASNVGNILSVGAGLTTLQGSINSLIYGLTVASVTGLVGVAGQYDGQFASAAGYYAVGDGGGGRFRWSASTAKNLHDGGTIISPTVPYTATAAGHVAYLMALGETAPAGFGCWVRVIDGAELNAAWFGPIGDGNETTYTVASYVAGNTSGTVWSYTITTQTRDANAINCAIRRARALKLSVLMPSGTFAVWAYLEPIDWSCTLRGAGAGRTTLRNCAASPTNAGGYGILTLMKSLNDARNAVAQQTDAVVINARDFTADGNAVLRTKPTGEFECYPVAVYGYIAKGSSIENVALLNSPIDCFMTSYRSGDANGLDVRNCYFKDSFRNTYSHVSGDNLSARGCSIIGGGQIQGGTNPKYCLDLEPNSSATTNQNVSFEQCLFEDAVNAIIGGVWTKARFTGCTVRAYNRNGSTLTASHQPWVTGVRHGDFTFSDCKFYGDTSRQNELRADTTGDMGSFATSAVSRFIGCHFDGVGMLLGDKQHIVIRQCTVLNTKRGWRLDGNNNAQAKLTIDGLRMVNAFECFPSDGRAKASFYCIAYLGHVQIDGVSCVFDPSLLPTGDTTTFITTASGTADNAFGFYLPVATYGTVGTRNGSVIVRNCHAEGYSQRFPAYFSLVQSYTHWQDWNTAGVPADNASRTVSLSDPPAYFGCTQGEQ